MRMRPSERMIDKRGRGLTDGQEDNLAVVAVVVGPKMELAG